MASPVASPNAIPGQLDKRQHQIEMLGPLQSGAGRDVEQERWGVSIFVPS
jgi:hypothetical protein